MDGKKMKNVHSVSFQNRNVSPYSGDKYEKDKDDAYDCNIGMVHKDENGLLHHHHIVASRDSDLGKDALERGVAYLIPELPDFVVIKAEEAKQSELDKEVDAYFGK